MRVWRGAPLRQPGRDRHPQRSEEGMPSELSDASRTRQARFRRGKRSGRRRDAQASRNAPPPPSPGNLECPRSDDRRCCPAATACANSEVEAHLWRFLAEGGRVAIPACAYGSAGRKTRSWLDRHFPTASRMKVRIPRRPDKAGYAALYLRFFSTSSIFCCAVLSCDLETAATSRVRRSRANSYSWRSE